MSTHDVKLMVERCGEGFSGSFVGPHDAVCQAVRSEGFSFLTAEQFARQRVQLGFYHQVSWTGSIVRDHLVYQNDAFWFVRADDGLTSFAAPGQAERFHRDGQEIPFEPSDLQDAVLVGTESFEMDTLEFDSHPVSRFLFGSYADTYGRWLADGGIEKLPVQLPPMSLVRHHPYAFERPLIVRCTDNWSGVISTNADLHFPYGYRCWSDSYAGDVQPVETFSGDDVTFLRTFAPVGDTPTLQDVEQTFKGAGVQHVLGAALRKIRAGSGLPVNYQNWQR